MKRALIFSLNYYPRFVGGAEVAIKEITDRIGADEIEFHMVTLRFDSRLPKVEKIGNVTVHRIGFATKSPTIADLRKFPLSLNKFLYQFTASAYARKLHKKYHFDFIWAMMAHAAGIPAGSFKKSCPDVPYILTLQEGDPTNAIEEKMRPLKNAFTAGFVSADAIQAISTFLLAWGRRMGAKGYGEVIPNGVDGARFARAISSEERHNTEEKLSKKEDEVFLVTTSRLVHKNGIDTVIRSLIFMPGNVTFLIFGIGPDEQLLRILAKGLGVEDRVRFMGEVGHDELPAILNACDIFIRPSRSEGMGNSFIEAMAAGLPVIATQEGGLADFIFDETHNPDKEMTAWVVEKESPEQIGEAVKAILADKEKVAKVTATAKKMVLASYDWKLVAERMEVLFKRVMAHETTPPKP